MGKDFKKAGWIMSLYKYFTDDEVRGLDVTFVQKLENAREFCGIPFIITSGLRSPQENQSLTGAVSDSAHLKGLAVDLLVHSSEEVGKMVQALNMFGILRVGIYVDDNWTPIHLHCDLDSTKPTPCIFVLKEKN